jgi:hypothetical protein
MKFIKLTSIYHNNPIRINIKMIGHYVSYTETHHNKTETSTTVAVLTHNNGGLQVKETPEEIDKLIEEKINNETQSN